MQDSRYRINFPASLSEQPVRALDQPASDEEFAEQQINLALSLYSRADAQRVAGRDDAVPANFLRVFVNFIDVMEANDPGDASVCALELRKILLALYGGPPGTN